MSDPDFYTQGSQYRYFMHDSLGRLNYAKQVEMDANSNFSGSSYTDPITSNNQWSEKYLYNDNGAITSTTDARNVTVTASYDHIGRIYHRDYSDSTPDVDFYYDGRGLGGVPSYSNLKTTKVTSPASETKYMSFDIFGRTLTHRQSTDGNDYDTAYTYNLGGALIEETYPSGRVVKNTFDENGRLEQVQSKKNSSSGYWTYANNFAFDSAGNNTKMQLGNGHWETASFNNRQQVTMIGLGTTDTTQDLLKLEYKYDTNSTSYDNNGSMREQKITVPAVGGNAAFTATQTYTYDDLNRIASSTESVSSTQTWKQEFSYDRFGNRNFVTGSGHTTTLGSCSTAVCNPTISTSTNRISSSGYTFDANGNLTADATSQRFGYDAENHQTAFFIGTNGGSTPDATYYYDGTGKRVEKISSTETTVFVYDGGGQMIAEYSTALASTQQVSYMTQDHLGSPRIISNENGAVTNRKDYMAFGDQAVSTQRVSGSSGNGYDSSSSLRQDYTGYEKDSESGLEYAQARYYNPTVGRYTSVDPMIASATIKNPQTFNRYSYVLNSPYKFSDPLGLLPMNNSDGSCSAENSVCGKDREAFAEAPVAVPESHTNAPNTAPAIHESAHVGEHPHAQPPDPPWDPPFTVVITPGLPDVYLNRPVDNEYFTGVASLFKVQFLATDGKPLQGATSETNTPSSGTASVDQRKGNVPIQDGEIDDIFSLGGGIRSKNKQEFTVNGKDATEKQALDELRRLVNEDVINRTSEQTLTITTSDKRIFEVTYSRTLTNQKDGKTITDRNKNGINVVVSYTEPKIREIKIK